MQVVHILRAKKEAIAQAMFQLCKCNMRRIWLGLRARFPSRRVELPHPPGIALPSLRRAYIFDAIAGP